MASQKNDCNVAWQRGSSDKCTCYNISVSGFGPWDPHGVRGEETPVSFLWTPQLCDGMHVPTYNTYVHTK